MLQKRNIRVLFAISFLQGMVFYASVATLYRRAAGLDMFQIAVIESVSLLLSLALEVPWGIAADRIGYRKTMIVCSFLFAVSKIIFWRAETFGGFLIERILLAVVCAGISGVDESILVSSCSAEETHCVFGWYGAFGTCGLMGASVVYSLFIGENYRLAAFLTVVSYGLAAFLSLLVQNTHAVNQETACSRRSFGRLFHQLIRNRGLMLVAVSCALFAECVQVMTVFLNQLQYERCGWPVSWMGAAHVLSTAIMLLGAFSAKWTKRVGERQMGVGLMMLSAVACGMLAFTKSGFLSLGCVLTLGMCGSLLMPLGETIKNRMIGVQNRATALSVLSVLTNGIAAGMEALVGRIADISLPCAMLLCACLCASALGLFAASKTAASFPL